MFAMSRQRLLRWGVGGISGATAAVVISNIENEEEEEILSLPQQPDHSVTRDAVEVGGAGILSGVGLTKITSFALCGIGFTEAGVAAKSIAAAIQSQIGNVAAGSTFAKAQAVGAKGGLAFFGPVGLGVAIAVGTGFALYKVQQYMKEEEERLRREEEERFRREEEAKNKQLCNRVKKIFYW